MCKTKLTTPIYGRGTKTKLPEPIYRTCRSPLAPTSTASLLCKCPEMITHPAPCNHTINDDGRVIEPHGSIIEPYGWVFDPFLQSSHTVELLIHGLCNFALIERGFKNRDRYLNRVTRLNCRATRSSYRSLFLKSRFIEAKWQNTQGSITEQGGSITRSSYRSARLSYRSPVFAISPR